MVVLEISLTTTLNILCICDLKNEFLRQILFWKRNSKKPQKLTLRLWSSYDIFQEGILRGHKPSPTPCHFLQNVSFFFFFSLLFFFISQYVFHRGYSTRQLKLIHAKSLPLCEARLVPERNAKESSSQRCCREAPALAH